jgi:hypothetical protein
MRGNVERVERNQLATDGLKKKGKDVFKESTKTAIRSELRVYCISMCPACEEFMCVLYDRVQQQAGSIPARPVNVGILLREVELV